MRGPLLRLVGGLLALLTAATGHGQSPADPAHLAPGMLLVARPELSDPNFRRTVILLVRYDSEGAMGVVINRRSQATLRDTLPEREDLEIPQRPVFAGGPVARRVLFVAVRTSEAIPGTFPVFDEVRLGYRRDTLRAVLDADRDGLQWRAFVGHAGWAPGQLEAEIKRGDWLLREGSAERVFSSEPATLWQRLAPPSGQWVQGPLPTTAMGALATR